MKQIFTFCIIAFFLKTIFSCASKSQDNFSTENKVVKITKIKVYTAKQDFDKLTIGEPVFNMRHDDNLDMDLNWETRYFDKYNNVLKLENFQIDNNGKEKIYRTIYYQYYSPQENKLSSRKTIMGSDNEEEKYIRNSDGLLTEIIKIGKYKEQQKTLFTHNATGQRVKEEVYEEKGLKKSFEYTYDSPQEDKGHIIKEININYDLTNKNVSDDNYESYSVKIEREWSNEGKLISSSAQELKNGEVLFDNKYYYKQYVGDIAIKIIVEGFHPPAKEVNLLDLERGISNETIVGERQFFRHEITKTLNTNNDIIECSLYGEVLNEKGQVISKKFIPYQDRPKSKETLRESALRQLKESGGHQKVNNIKFSPLDYERTDKYTYTYNQKNEWIEILYSFDKYQKHFILREIKYLN